MYFEDVQLNTLLQLEPVLIEKEKMIAFAREYDSIPLHTDEEYAKKAHFGGLIAPGVMTYMAVWAKYQQQNQFGDELIAGKSTAVEWFHPVYPGDTLSAAAEVTGLTKRNARNGIVEVTINARNQHGDLVLTGVTEIIIKCKPASAGGSLC